MIVFTETILDVERGYITMSLSDDGDVLYVRMDDDLNNNGKSIYRISLEQVMDRYPNSKMFDKAKIFLRDKKIDDILEIKK